MAFNKKFFQPIGGTARGGLPGDKKTSAQVGSYEHPTDSQATMVAAGYFNEVRDIVQPNDMVSLANFFVVVATWRISFFATVPKSPLTTDVTINTLDMNSA